MVGQNVNALMSALHFWLNVFSFLLAVLTGSPTDLGKNMKEVKVDIKLTSPSLSLSPSPPLCLFSALDLLNRTALCYKNNC